MMHDPKLADFLFIVLVGVLIWGIMWLVGRSRGTKRASSPEGNNRREGNDRSSP